LNIINAHLQCGSYAEDHPPALRKIQSQNRPVARRSNLTLSLTCKRASFVLAAALLVMGGFVSGFLSCLHLNRAASDAVREKYLQPAGDAPPAVRAGVIEALKAFQDGYVQRDPREIDAFMSRLFSRDSDPLILGANGAEWARGYPAVSAFIGNDWRNWGDFRFDADHAIIWSSGEVAWIATVGTVHSIRGQRPLRFSAILTRNGDRWQFRQVSFQWDEQEPATQDILRPKTYLQIFQMGLHSLRNRWDRF
jgi:hypothetical protein